MNKVLIENYFRVDYERANQFRAAFSVVCWTAIPFSLRRPSRVNNRFQEMLTFIIAVSMSFALARVSGFVRDDCVCGVANTDSRRIIKGTVTEPSKYPWMVALYSTHRKAYCGGALVSDKHVKRVPRRVEVFSEFSFLF